MADVTIYGSLPTSYNGGSNSRIIWTTSSVGYVFYNHSDGSDSGYNGTIYYKKTTDGGATWGSEVRFLRPSPDNDGFGHFSIWYDQETPGDTGTLIHLVASDWDDNSAWYSCLDTSNDTQGTTVQVAANIAGTDYADFITNGWSVSQSSITKARGGNLYVWVRRYDQTGSFWRSTNGGTSWSSRTSPDEAVEDRAQLMPAGDTDANDIACLFFDHDAFELTFKLYDDSGNSWGNETFIGGMVHGGGGGTTDPIPNPDKTWCLSVAINPVDNKAWVSWWFNQFDNFPGNLQTAILTLTAAGKNSTSTTDVLTSVSEAQECCILIDANNAGTAYIAYLKGTWESSVNVYYKKTTDSMATWGSEIQLNTTTHNIFSVNCQTVIQSGNTGRFEPTWDDEGNNDLLCNYGLSVELLPGPYYQSVGSPLIGANGPANVPAPASLASGDCVLIAVMSYNVLTDASLVVAGFEKFAQVLDVGGSNQTILTGFWRVCDGTEGSDFALSGSSSGYVDAIAIRITGADATTPIDAFSTNHDINTAVSATGITAASTYELLVIMHAGFNNDLSVDYDGSVTHRTGFDSVQHIETKKLIASGATGNFAATLSNSDTWCNIVVGITRVAVGGSMTASGAVTLPSLRARGYGPRQVIRPNSTSDAASWTAVGAGSLYAATNDDSNSSYDNLNDGDDPSTMKLGLQTLSTPDVGNGEIIIRVEAVP